MIATATMKTNRQGAPHFWWSLILICTSPLIYEGSLSLQSDNMASQFLSVASRFDGCIFGVWPMQNVLVPFEVFRCIFCGPSYSFW